MSHVPGRSERLMGGSRRALCLPTRRRLRSRLHSPACGQKLPRMQHSALATSSLFGTQQGCRISCQVNYYILLHHHLNRRRKDVEKSAERVSASHSEREREREREREKKECHRRAQSPSFYREWAHCCQFHPPAAVAAHYNSNSAAGRVFS